MGKKVWPALILLFCLGGCALLRPLPLREERISWFEDMLRTSILEERLFRLGYANDINYKLLAILSQKDIKKTSRPVAYLGLHTAEVDDYLARLYRLSHKKGLVVIAVTAGSPAEEAGILPGDILVSASNRRLNTLRNLKHSLRKLKKGDSFQLAIKRQATVKNIDLEIDFFPFVVPVVLVENQRLKAAVSQDAIYISYGLLDFTRSDSEFAAVLAYQLAHLMLGHARFIRWGSFFSALLEPGRKVASGTGNLVLENARFPETNYSLKQEKEAERLALEILNSAGFNPCIFPFFLSRLDMEVPQPKPQGYLSGRSFSDRILRIKKAAKEITGNTCP